MTAAEYNALPKRRAGHRVIITPLDGEPRESGRLLLSQVPPSVNGLFGNSWKGRKKTMVYSDWLSQAQWDLRQQESWHVPGTVKISFWFGRSQTSADLDNLIKPTLDMLVAAGRISDDKNVAKIEAEFADVQGAVIEIAKASAGNHDARHFRAQIPTSTDPDYLERMANAAEAARSA
jgi:hypothetical protein